jgi:hypothetical protein
MAMCPTTGDQFALGSLWSCLGEDDRRALSGATFGQLLAWMRRPHLPVSKHLR